MQEEHARLQQEVQARVHELTMQLMDACTSAAQQLAQVLNSWERRGCISKPLDALE